MWHLVLCITSLLVGQDPHQGMNDRRAMVMGFDQTRTAHHFYLYDDGGAIQIAVKDPADTRNRDAIRSHLPHIAEMFGMGDFDAPMLVHDTHDVPGITVLTERKDKIRYRYVETATGGRVDVVTTDAKALTALHEFLKYQIREHQTGDSGLVSKRGK